MNIKLNLNEIPKNSKTHVVYPEFIMDEKSNVKYYPLESFKKKLNTSDSTVRRMIDRVKDERSEHLFFLFCGKYYLSLVLAEPAFKKELNKKNIRQNYNRYLKKYDWQLFGAVNFNLSLDIANIRQIMERFFNELKVKLPLESITLFFATEINSDRSGFHVHFLIDYNNAVSGKKIKSFCATYFKKRSKRIAADLLIEEFDRGKGGINYILKQINLFPDGYDIFLS